MSADPILRFSSRWRSWGAGATLITLLTVAAYFPALRAGFVWDDDFYVTENSTLRSVEGLRRIWTRPGIASQQYYPLTFSGFWAQYHLWKLQPFGYHLVNILLHVLNAVLLWRVLRHLKLPGAWWTAAIFALHPVQVESVAWITEFKNVLSGLFSLLSLMAFLRFHPLSFTETTATRDWRFYALAILLFFGALLSKTAVCCLPVVIVLLVWWKQKRVGLRDALALMPWFAASMTLGLATVHLESSSFNTQSPRSVVQSVLLAGRALWFYAGKVLWPRQIAFIYPRWVIDSHAAWQYSFPLAALAVLVALWILRRRVGNGPLAGALCFVAMLLPVLGFFNIFFFRYSYVADHFQYLACIGLIALAVATATKISQQAGPQGRHLAAFVAVVVLLRLGVSTWGQTHVYRNDETLWRDTIATNPRAVIAQTNLGLVLYGQLQYRRAMDCFDEALQADPDSVEAHYNLGLVLMELAHYSKAVTHMRRALLSAPHFAKAENGLGFALLQLGQSDEAALHFQLALELDPDYVEAYNNLGKTLQSFGKTAEAEARFRRALQIRPTDFDTHENLGALLLQQHRLDEASTMFHKATSLKPDDPDPHTNLADILTAQLRPQEAQQERALAASLAEHLSDTHYRIATTLLDADDLDGAVKHFRKSMALRPNSADTYLTLSRVLARQNRFPEAVAVLRQGLQAAPEELSLRNELSSLLAQSNTNARPSP
jgi:protein O-mannosyl-transferase